MTIDKILELGEYLLQREREYEWRKWGRESE